MNAATAARNAAENCTPGSPCSPAWKRVAKGILPPSIQRLIRAFIRLAEGLTFFSEDFLRYVSNSGVYHASEETRLRARITASYHILEKGLSHHDPRPGFGRDAAAALARLLTIYYGSGYRTSCSQYQSAISVLQCYRDLQLASNTSVPAELDQFFEEISPQPVLSYTGGHTSKSGAELLASWRRDFRALALNRHSIRHFADTPVSDDAIQRAVDLARWAPSACNRQPVRVHVVKDRQQLDSILTLQGGARGFTELIGTLLIVTADVRAYIGFAERHLPYVDGGLFAMTLIYALCFEGIGSCPLHMALPPTVQQKIRNILSLNEAEALVVMLGLGNLPETLKLAHSQRKPLCEYFVLH